MWAKSSRCDSSACAEVEWRKSSFCDAGQCGEIAFAGEGVAIRNNQAPEDLLTFTAADWQQWLDWLRQEQ